VSLLKKTDAENKTIQRILGFVDKLKPCNDWIKIEISRIVNGEKFYFNELTGQAKETAMLRYWILLDAEQKQELKWSDCDQFCTGIYKKNGELFT
jgi:hypothetical protein